MAKKHVQVADLQIGMYIAELDRPWLESNFLYQGFIVENDEQLAQLRDQCDYVYIDAEKGDDVTESAPSGAGAEAKFQRELQSATSVRQRGARIMTRLLQDMRLGESLRTEEARQVVSELAASVSNNANASMWLTNLQRKHERAAAHSMNVCVLALAFARYLGYEGDELEAIGLGALLHDIGLMRVPADILDRPGTLTAQEFEQIKAHPAEGYNVLRLTRTLPQVALDIVRYHHERINGGGYPEGLAGDKLPRIALVVAIADTYDSLTSDSPYSDVTVPPHEALGILRSIAASDFGESLVEEFIRCLGIYPVGSLVRLTNGTLAVVVSHTQQARLRPVVMILQGPDGTPYPNRPHVNLDRLPADVDKAQWTIRGIVDPRKENIDMTSVAAAQVGGAL